MLVVRLWAGKAWLQMGCEQLEVTPQGGGWERPACTAVAPNDISMVSWPSWPLWCAALAVSVLAVLDCPLSPTNVGGVPGRAWPLRQIPPPGRR